MKNDVTELVGQNDAKEIHENSLGTKAHETDSHNLHSVPEWKKRLGTTKTAMETTSTLTEKCSNNHGTNTAVCRSSGNGCFGFV